MGDFLEKIPQTPLKLLSHKQSLPLYKVLCGAFFQESDPLPPIFFLYIRR